MSFCGLIAHFFSVLNNIPLSGCSILFIHSPTEGHFGCFQGLAVMKLLCSFLCGPARRDIAGLYGKTVFSFGRYC